VPSEVLAWSAITGEDAFKPTCDIKKVERKITAAAKRRCNFMVLLRFVAALQMMNLLVGELDGAR